MAQPVGIVLAEGETRQVPADCGRKALTARGNSGKPTAHPGSGACGWRGGSLGSAGGSHCFPTPRWSRKSPQVPLSCPLAPFFLGQICIALIFNGERSQHLEVSAFQGDKRKTLGGKCLGGAFPGRTRKKANATFPSHSSIICIFKRPKPS